MAKNLFRHKVHLIPLRLKNSERNLFRAELMNIPYLLYEVENLSTGEKLLVNKPRGKSNFSGTCGLAAEILLKVYKWIWGQEDCNYQSQKAEGRWKSMNAILEEFNLKKC